MSRRSCRAKKEEEAKNEEEEESDITSGDEAEKEYESHANEPTDSDEVIDQKIDELIKMIMSSHTKLIYTGAGISTAANIPDYRGPGGVYTMAKKGVQVKCHNIISTSPTVSHLVVKELYRHRYISHIVSQNCDGLHLRSGLPQAALSEIHGNMHIEVCSSCEDRQFIRNYDVTEKSGFRSHETSRNCSCGAPLLDTIVHFGECGTARYPLNWEAAQEIVPIADLIICIGSSLQVLKDYKFLWPEKGSECKIVIINLQWTPKDADAALVIRGDCESILTKLANKMKIEIKHYCRDCDPILYNRRHTRRGTLDLKINDCNCHIRAPRALLEPPTAKKKDYCPGWWRVGLRMVERDMKRDRRSNTAEDSEDEDQPCCSSSSSDNRSTRTRGVKRTKGSDDVDSSKGKRRASHSEDEDYEPERHLMRGMTSTKNKTRKTVKRKQTAVKNTKKQAGTAKGVESAMMEEPEEEKLGREMYGEGCGDEEWRDQVEYPEFDGNVGVYEEVITGEMDIGNEVEIGETRLMDFAEYDQYREYGEQVKNVQRQKSGDEDSFIDVVGDDEERCTSIQNESTPGSILLSDQSEIFMGDVTALDIPLSQLNDVSKIKSTGFVHRPYDYTEDPNYHQMGSEGSSLRYSISSETSHASSHSFTHNGQSKSMMQPTPLSSQPSYHQLQPAHKHHELEVCEPPTNRPSPPPVAPQVYKRKRRNNKKGSDPGSVQFLLSRAMAQGISHELLPFIGAVYEEARMLMSPDEDVDKFTNIVFGLLRDRERALQQKSGNATAV